MNTFLANLEAKIQSLLEDSLDRLLHPGASHSLSGQLLTLIKENIKAHEESGDKYAPDLIKIHIPSERWDAWHSIRHTLDELADEIESSFTAEGYKFHAHPHIQLIATPYLALDDIKIETTFFKASELTGQTSLIELPSEKKAFVPPAGACFIVNGTNQLALTKAIIRIGRHSSNDIVIQDPMVSREHLQLRAQGNRYLLFDLSSTGGTTINAQNVHSAILKPGDVVRIGQTVMIYNQDLPESTTKTIVSVAD